MKVPKNPLHPKIGERSGLEELEKVTWGETLTPVEFPAAASSHGAVGFPTREPQRPQRSGLPGLGMGLEGEW